MFQLERINEIEKYLVEKGNASINELSETFQVSKVTIRRDIDLLESQGRVLKTYGGAIAVKNKLNVDIPHDIKMSKNMEAKKLIGKAAAGLVEDNDMIIVDTGTTTLNMIRNITAKNVTVITNDLMIALEVVKYRCAELIMPGGTWQSNGYALVGNQTSDMFRKMHADKVFIGCDAVDMEFGVSTRNMNAVALKEVEMGVADKAYLMVDSSKFAKKAFYSLCPPSALDYVITEKIDDGFRTFFEKSKVKVIITDNN